MGLEGFTGNESILYHLQSPCRVTELGAVRADRARGVGSRRARAPAPEDRRRRAGRGRDLRPADADVERRRRDLALPPDRDDGLLLPQRRGRRGDLRPRGLGDAGDDLRRPALPRRRLRRRAARDDLSLPAGGPAAASRVRDAGADRDPAPLPQPVRADRRGRAVLPPRHPSADRAATRSASGRVPGEGARPRRLPDLRRRLPPVRRRRLGRLPLPVDVLDPRLRADHGPDPPAAAVAPDVRGAGTSSSARSARASSTSTRSRCRSRTTTRICSRRR